MISVVTNPLCLDFSEIHNALVRVIAVMFLLIAATLHSAAQKVTDTNSFGIYLTREDFIANKISFLQKLDSSHYLKIDFNNNIILKSGDEIVKFNFNEIFGYYNRGDRFRTYGHHKNILSDYGYYKVEDEGDIIIYSKETPTYKFYYFASNIDSDIHRLSLNNLEHHLHLDKLTIEDLKKSKRLLTSRKGEHMVVNVVLHDKP